MQNNKYLWTPEDNAIAETELAIATTVRAAIHAGKSIEPVMDGPARLAIAALGRKYHGDYRVDVDPNDGSVTITRSVPGSPHSVGSR